MSARRAKAEVPVDVELDEGLVRAHALGAALGASLSTGRACRLLAGGQGRGAGLGRRDLSTIRAAAATCGAAVRGLEIGSAEVRFAPGPVASGAHRLRLGNGAGVAPLLAMLVPPLAASGERVELTVEGATDAPRHLTVDALAHAWLPVLRLAGADVTMEIERRGFPPVGGGLVRVGIGPGTDPASVELRADAADASLEAECTIAHIAGDVDRRELDRVGAALGIPPERRHARTVDAPTSGNVLRLVARHADRAEALEEFGIEGVSAETIADRLVKRWRKRAGRPAAVPADHVMLLLPVLAAFGGGRVPCREPRESLARCVGIVEAFGAVRIDWRAGKGDAGELSVGAVG